MSNVEGHETGLFHKTFLYVIYGHFAVNYNFLKLLANLRTKFGRSYEYVIYGSVKFYGIGPSFKQLECNI